MLNNLVTGDVTDKHQTPLRYLIQIRHLISNSRPDKMDCKSKSTVVAPISVSPFCASLIADLSAAALPSNRRAEYLSSYLRMHSSQHLS